MMKKATETTDTYTFTPSERSIFSPENITNDSVILAPKPVKSMTTPIKLQPLTTRKS